MASWALAIGWRLRSLEQTSIGSDSIGQLLPGLAPLALHNPPNPEAGYALWVTAAPLVWLADSLTMLFTLRFVVGALIAPLGFLVAWRLARTNRLLAGAIAGGLLAMDSGLVDTLVSSFRGYGAPELLAGASLGLLVGHRAGLVVGAVLLVAAAGHHPFAAGAALGAALVLPWGDRGAIALAVGAGILIALPRLAWIADLADCGAGLVACLSPVALGSSEPLSRADLLVRALSDRAGELSVALPVMLLGLALCRDRRALLLALGATVGVVTLALSVHSLRPYHLRIVAAPLAVAAALGLSRWRGLGAVGGLIGVIALAAHPPPLGDPGALSRHDATAAALSDQPDPVWVEGAWYGGEVALDPAATVLSAILQGQPAARFGPGGSIVLLVSREDGAEVVTLRDAAAAREWLGDNPNPEVLGGASDWASILRPGVASDWW
ncbi:MAG: hypothetical protein ACI8RZ_002415 [Myxococcota bacterium]|jgi:hypothetical protein